MALLKGGEIVEDPFTQVGDEEAPPEKGAVIVGLDQWRENRKALVGRGEPLGVRLHSDQSPSEIRADLEHFAVVALEFPAFKDGRAYSYARLLRERYGYTGEIRAVGDVLCNQLQFMLRCGFDAFDVADGESLEELRAACDEFHVFYQPTADGHPTASSLRNARRGG